MRLHIIDYGSSNLFSVQTLCHALGYETIVTHDAATIKQASLVILPGVGAFGAGMTEIRKRQLAEPICDHIHAKKPFIGICLGFQLLFEYSEESPDHPGLGIFKGHACRFNDTHKIPHMGWNTLSHTHPTRPFFLKEIPPQPHVYFVHSYYIHTTDAAIIGTKTTYGTSFVSSIYTPTLFASQFHPEKSGPIGIQLFKNTVAHLTQT